MLVLPELVRAAVGLCDLFDMPPWLLLSFIVTHQLSINFDLMNAVCDHDAFEYCGVFFPVPGHDGVARRVCVVVAVIWAHPSTTLLHCNGTLRIWLKWRK